MKRAYLIEITVLKSYLRQLVFLGFVVAFFISLGMQSIVAVPAMLTMLMFMMSAMSAAAYDEQSNWGLFRLTMPVSRRDIVLARYGAIATVGLMGAGIGLAVAAVLTAGATLLPLPLPAEAVQALAYNPENVLGCLFSVGFCLMMGSVVAGVITPVYFRFGQTKATQYLPLITVLLFILPIVALNGGMLDNGAIHLSDLARLLDFIESPAGVAVSMAVFAAIAAVALALSAAVSLKVYEKREL